MTVNLCPACGSDTTVKDTRPTNYGIYSRRECTKCGFRYSTREISSDELHFYLDKIDDAMGTLNSLRRVISR